jgi:anaerobic ribonucleoside-triphosphate reductase activating protein
MLKFVDYDIVFREVPDEVTLALNLAGCPNGCPGCHSSYLMQDIGHELTADALDDLLLNYQAEVTCLCFMGGDASPHEVARWARHIRLRFPGTKVAWYSGRALLPDGFDTAAFHYIKLGPYVAERGPLDNPNTNQRFFYVSPNGELTDQTARFWRK